MSNADTRSQNYVKQLKGSALFKLGAILATFLAMPIMIKYLGVERFGIWSTMLTLVTWVMLFDLGIGNGLRNKISEALAEKNETLAAKYIATSYVIVGVIAFSLFLIFLLVSFLIPWGVVFNTKIIAVSDLHLSVVVLAFFIFFNFWLSLVLQVYHGLQKSSFVTFGQFLSNSIALLFVCVLYFFYAPSILNVVYVYGASIVFSNLLLSFLVYRSYSELRPILRNYEVGKVRYLFSLGARFFVIQIAVILIFMTDKIIITQLLGPEYVTSYDVLFKLFSIFTIVHGLLLTPLWPAYSNAFAQKDFQWLKYALIMQVKIACVIFFGAIILIFVGPYVVALWIGSSVNVSPSLYYFFCAFVVVSVWSNVFAYFVNAVNAISIQMYTSIIAALINIPMSMFFVLYLELGLQGVVLATTLSLLIFGFVGPVQVYYILKRGVI